MIDYRIFSLFLYLQIASCVFIDEMDFDKGVQDIWI